MGEKPNRFVSALSGLGILLVVVGHAQAGPAAHAGLAPGHEFYAAFSTSVRFIYTFHMPLFFLISGYLLMHATLRNGSRPYPSYGRFLRDKAKRLLAPYVAISTLAFPIKVVLAKEASRPVTCSVAGYLQTLLLPWHNTIIFFWFLPTLFLMLALAPALLRRSHAWPIDGALLGCGIVLWFLFPNRHEHGPLSFLNVGGLLHNFVFFAAGFTISKYRLDRWQTALHPAWILAGPIGLALFVPFRDMIWMRFALCLLGLLFSMATARALCPVLARLGDISFDIYLFSWFPQVAFRILLGQVLVVHTTLLVAGSIAAGLLFPLGVGSLRLRLLPGPLQFLFGGTRTPLREDGRPPVSHISRQRVHAGR